MRIRLTIAAVCVLLVTMMFGGTAFAAISLGLPATQTFAKIGTYDGFGYSPGQHLIASVGNDFYALMLEDHTGGNLDLVLYHSPDAGITWMDRKVIAANIGWDYKAMTVDPTTKIVHVLWIQSDVSGQRLTYANSSDTTPIEIAATGTWAFSIAVDTNGIPHVVYADGGTAYYSYYNSGTFTSPSSIGNGTVDTLDLTIIRGDNTLYLATSEMNSSSVSLYSSPASSGTWSAPISVCGTSCAYNGADPSIAAYSNGTTRDIYLAWNGNDGSANKVLTRHFNHATGQWVQSAPVAVFASPGAPSIAVGTDSIPVVTFESNSNTLYMARASSSTGTTWPSNSKATLTLPTRVEFPSLTLDGSNKACFAYGLYNITAFSREK